MKPILWHNDQLRQTVEAGASATAIRELLRKHDCLTFPQLPSGLFPAINVSEIADDETGYANAWIRDSVWVTYGLWRDGQLELAQRACRGLLQSLHKIKPFFEETVKSGKVSRRPPVRFTGLHSDPLTSWANAQNDALGYSIWLISLMAQADDVKLDESDHSVIALILEYLKTIEYWQDSDSGQWEEIPKLNASSIAAVVAGLIALRPILVDTTVCDELIAKGRDALQKLLPNESATPGLERQFDAGQLFMIEPLGLITGAVAKKIVANIEHHLVGEVGVRRYKGDSYWGPDYREHFLMGARASDFSDQKNMAARDKFLTPDSEAQWTLFDPILAAYYAKQFTTSHNQSDEQLAHYYLARSLAQIVEQSVEGRKLWRIPEAYFLEHKTWVANDHIGLLWSQANLLHALKTFEDILQDTPVANLTNTK